MSASTEDSIITPNPPASVAWGGSGLVNFESSNPWNKNKVPIEPCKVASFKELMSEDLAKDLQEREEEKFVDSVTSDESLNLSMIDIGSTCDTSNDLMLALLLQQDFNREHDNQVQREENHLNKNSKLSVSFSNFKVCPEPYDSDSEDEFHLLDDENRAIDCFEESRKSDPVLPPCGYMRHNNRMVTKHDKTISGRRNAEKVMSFPPEFNTGDAGGFDMQISNKVYNKLARCAMSEAKRKQRLHDKFDKATTEKALDPKTRLIVFKMVNNSILECVNGTVSTGKESVVFHAQGGIYEDVELPSECAVKVFKTTLTDFKTRERYIRDDYRFKDRMSKNNNKMNIQLWAEKEFHNLRRLRKAKIPSPNPFLIRKHVLVMSFIGEGQVAAPKLKHVRLPYDSWCCVYEEVVDIMTTMFRKCNLIHGDMSEYNLLWFDDKCWVIDLGQAVEPIHPNALRFLHRDCSNVIGFFKSKGLTHLPSPLQLFEKVTAISLPGHDEDAHRLIDEYEVNQELFRKGVPGREDELFEFLWKEIQKKNTEEEPVEKLEKNVDVHLSEKEDLERPDTVKCKKKKKKKKSVKNSIGVDNGVEKKIVDQDFLYVNAEDSTISRDEQSSSTVVDDSKPITKETKCRDK